MRAAARYSTLVLHKLERKICYSVFQIGYRMAKQRWKLVNSHFLTRLST